MLACGGDGGNRAVQDAGCAHIALVALFSVPALEAARKRAIVKKTFEESKKNGDIYKISVYASTDERKFFADCFLIWEMGKEKLPGNIEKMMKEVLKNTGRKAPGSKK